MVKNHQICQADCTLRNLTKIHQNQQIHQADFTLTTLAKIHQNCQIHSNIHSVWPNFIKSAIFVKTVCIFGHKSGDKWVSRKRKMVKLDLSCQRKIEVTHLVTNVDQGKKS